MQHYTRHAAPRRPATCEADTAPGRLSGRGGEPPHLHQYYIRVGGSAAHRYESTPAPARVGVPAARPGGRVREPRGHTRRAGRPPSHRAPAVPRGRVVRARANAFCRAPGPPKARRAQQQPAPRTHHSGSAARLPAPSSPSIAAGQRASSRPRCDSVAVKLPKLGARRPICIWWAIHAADAHRDTGRAAWARYSARTRERRGERANWPPLTRPTVRGLAVVGSSASAEGRKDCRAARRSGTSRRRPSPKGHWAAARAFGALCRAAVRRAATRKITTLSSPAFVILRLVTTVSPPANHLFSLGCASGRPPR